MGQSGRVIAEPYKVGPVRRPKVYEAESPENKSIEMEDPQTSYGEAIQKEFPNWNPRTQQLHEREFVTVITLDVPASKIIFLKNIYKL
jgi:hypothetical protein